jgi:ferredoxin
MAYYILNDCIECGVCLPECPEAISEGSPYTIDPKLCNECGACAEVCPVDVCVPMPRERLVHHQR